MWTLIIGGALFLASLIASAGGSSFGMFVNAHALSITLGGTVAVLLLSNSMKSLVNLLRKIREIPSEDRDISGYQEEILSLSNSRMLNDSGSEDPLLKYGAELFEKGIEPEMFVVLLSQKKDKIEKEYLDAAMVLRNLAKYPPALGMIGTVMGVVTLFSSLNSNNKEMIGPALAVAMTATFFGLTIAHGIVMPLADRILSMHSKRKDFYGNIYNMLLLVNRDESEALIREEIKEREAA